MSWATHPTSEMPPSLGRHRRSGPTTVVLVLAGVLLLTAVGAAALAPSIFGWSTEAAFSPPPTMPGAAPSTVEPGKATPTTTPEAKRKSTPSATKPPPRPATALSDVDRLVLTLTNAERMRKGCGPLRLDKKLTTAARLHSIDMATYQYLDHESRNGDDPGDRMRDAGYHGSRGWAENIAKGPRTAQSVVELWMDSKGHRDNILNCSWRSMGVAAARVGSSGQIYWTQDFGTR